MPAFEVKVEGLAELQAKLNDMKTDGAKRIMNRALRAGGEVFKEEVEQRAPVRPELPSGTALPPGALQHDISVKTITGDAKSGIVLVGPGRLTRHVARWVEFGHRLVRGGTSRLLANGKTRGRGSEVGQVPAHPFMRPAFEAGVQRALEAVKASIVDDLAKLDKKKGGK
jgi:HK97 gp10 family phage protein